MKKLFATVALLGVNASFLMAQDSYSLSTILENQNLSFDEVSISPDQSTFAGISNASASLFIAQKKFGDYNLPTTIDTKLTEGAFRPLGFNENEYLYFTVYDASSIVPYKFLKASKRNNLKNNYNYKKSNFAPFVMNSYADNQSRSIRVLGYYRNDRMEPYHRMYSNSSSFTQYYNYSIKDRNVILFTETNGVVCFTDNINRIKYINLDGTVQSENELVFNSPVLWGNKERSVIRDEKSNKYYIVITTNFSYNWYEVNPTTGATKFLLKMDDVWESPNWKIENSVLSYDKVEAGKTERKTVKF